MKTVLISVDTKQTSSDTNRESQDLEKERITNKLGFFSSKYMVHTSNKGFLQVSNDFVDTKSKLHASWHKSLCWSYNSYISTDFVQWIVIVTSKSMHLEFYAKKGLTLK